MWQQKILQIISRPGSSTSKDLASISTQVSAQVEFLTLKSKCQASLAATLDVEQYKQGLIQFLKQFCNNQDNEENENKEDVALLDDSYVDP